MRICFCFLLALTLVSAIQAAEVVPVSPDAAAQLLNDVATGRALFFNTDPAFGTVEQYPDRPAANAILKSTGGYIVKLSVDKSGNLLRMKFSLKRQNGKTFKTISYGMTADTNAIPYLKDMQFYPGGMNQTAGNRNPPMTCVNGNDGNPIIVLGFADQVEVAEIHYNGPVMKLARPASWETITAREIKDGIYLDLSNQYWFDALKGYAKYADKYRGFKPKPIPPQAYEPVWCSWYTLTTSIDEKNIWENAVIAKSLGIGTILMDAGWDSAGQGWLSDNSRYGDRLALRNKFPDMTGLVDRIHNELGMAVELWASPWMIGKKSLAEKEIADVRIRLGEEQKPGFMLCARCAKSGDFLAKNLSDCIKYYHLDGMWWDFIGSVPIYDCKGHKHDYETFGQGYNAAMTKVMDAVHKVKPDALIEIRLESSNINNKLFANIMETYDTPLYVDDNRKLLIYVRTFVDGCVPKTDPTMWQRSSEEGVKEADDSLIGRYMATIITVGVPAISQDFTRMSESNRQVVKAYLDFYHAHMMDLAKADFRPVGSDPNYPNYFLQGKKTAYIYSATSTMPKVGLKTAPGLVYMFNACDKAGIKFEISGLRPGKYQWTANDHFLKPVSNGEVEVTAEGLIWDAPLPAGGMIELRIDGG